MDRELANRIMDLIENLNVENLALRSLLQPPYGNADKAHLDSLLEEAKNSGVREIVHAQWKPLRDQLQSDKTLEEAFRAFLRIAPPSSEVN
jgi:hypothetical protein